MNLIHIFRILSGRGNAQKYPAICCFCLSRINFSKMPLLKGGPLSSSFFLLLIKSFKKSGQGTPPNFKEVKEIAPIKKGFIFVIIYFLSLLHIVHNLIWKAKLVSGRIGIKNIVFVVQWAFNFDFPWVN